MADSFAPPTGPPPPQVPDGWKAQYNEQYQTWFYVNLLTKVSQWDKPTAPATALDQKLGGAPDQFSGPNAPHNETDEEMARRLQAEESARAGGGGSGAAGAYYQGAPGGPGGPGYGPSTPYGDGQLPPRDQKKKGLLGSLKDKLSGGSSRPQQGYGGYGQQYPQQQYGGYGGYPQQQYGGAYGAPPRRAGMGPGAGLALGAGAGLLGGAMLGSAMADGHDGGDYGGDDGGDGGGDGGGDFGGGDMGGGDMGGGGDF